MTIWGKVKRGLEILFDLEDMEELELEVMEAERRRELSEREKYDREIDIALEMANNGKRKRTA